MLKSSYTVIGFPEIGKVTIQVFVFSKVASNINLNAKHSMCILSLLNRLFVSLSAVLTPYVYGY